MVKRWWQKYPLLILVLILALGLRLPQLDGSFWLDEAAQALESTRPWSQQLQIQADFQPPLLHLITALTIRISHQEWWLRLFGALIPGLITIVGTYFLGRKLKNEAVGILAALFLATSSFHIFYSQELRPYSLPAMWAILSWLALLDKKWSRYTLFSLLGLYSSYLYPFLWLGQAGWVLWQKRRQLRPFLSSTLLAVLGFLPWLPSFFSQLQAGTAVKAQLPGWAEVVSIPQFKALPLVLGKFTFGLLNLELSPFFIGLTLLIFGTLLVIFWQKRHKSKLLMPAIWFFVPLLTAWLVSFWVPVIRPKRLLLILPAFYLLISSLIYAGKEKASQRLGALISTLILIINLTGFWQYSFNPVYQRENWRGLQQEISQGYLPNEAILLFSFPQPFAPWRWYDQAQFPTLSTGQLKLETGQKLTAKIKAVAKYRYVLLFDYLRDLTDPQDELRTELWALGFREIRALDYPGIGLVRVFSNQKITASNVR